MLDITTCKLVSYTGARFLAPFQVSTKIIRLFLSQEYLYRATEEVKVRSELVFQEAAVRLADILRKVAEECKRRRAGRELCDVLDLDVLALPSWRRIVLYLRKHNLVDL